MGKRYYCDYCDRTLPYSVDARKKHNYGHQHRLAKRLYYDALKSVGERYQEQVKKEPCKRFFSGQYCSYGENCIYSHLTPDDISRLQQEAIAEEECLKLPALLRSGKEPSLDEIKGKLEEKFLHSRTHHIEQIIRSYCKPSSQLEGYSLPPSLQTPKFEDFIGGHFDTWG